MKLVVAAVGRLKAGPERALYERYAKRLGPAGKAAGLGPLETIEIAESRNRSVTGRKAEEAAMLRGRINDGARLVVLDETGENLSSPQFAQMIGRERDGGAQALVFCIGGPDGHGGEIRDNAAHVVSFGAMTLAHGLARVVLAEQLYRAVTILTGHPYHRA